MRRHTEAAELLYPKTWLSGLAESRIESSGQTQEPGSRLDPQRYTMTSLSTGGCVRSTKAVGLAGLLASGCTMSRWLQQRLVFVEHGFDEIAVLCGLRCPPDFYK